MAGAMQLTHCIVKINLYQYRLYLSATAHTAEPVERHPDMGIIVYTLQSQDEKHTRQTSNSVPQEQ